MSGNNTKWKAAPARSSLPEERERALDVARGGAVIGMVYMHLVAMEGGQSSLESACAAIAAFLEGKAAALFCILAGMTWALQAKRASTSPRYPLYILRRALSLAAIGILLHIRIWPTEILLPLALMMPICVVCYHIGPNAIRLAILLLLVADLLTVRLLGAFVASDWTPNGLHLADSSLGWQTLRYLVFDGNYPLLPWMVFPLFGMLLSLEAQKSVSKRAVGFAAVLSLAFTAHLYHGWFASHAESLGTYAVYLNVTWVPTSLPFLLLTGSSAAAVISGLLSWEAARGLPRPLLSMAPLGRASLTHYILHIGVVFVPLRLIYPDEQWSIHLGLLATTLYLSFAFPISALWFRRFSRGPLEGFWACLSGPSR